MADKSESIDAANILGSNQTILSVADTRLIFEASVLAGLINHDEMISKGMLETCAVILDEMRDETERTRLTRRIKRHWKID